MLDEANAGRRRVGSDIGPSSRRRDAADWRQALSAVHVQEFPGRISRSRLRWFQAAILECLGRQRESSMAWAHRLWSRGVQRLTDVLRYRRTRPLRERPQRQHPFLDGIDSRWVRT